MSFYGAKPLPDPEYHGRIVKSWDRIFDLGWVEEYVTGPVDSKSIQATIWQVDLNQVSQVTRFVNR